MPDGGIPREQFRELAEKYAEVSDFRKKGNLNGGFPVTMQNSQRAQNGFKTTLKILNS